MRDFRDIAPCSLVEVYRRFRGADGGSRDLPKRRSTPETKRRYSPEGSPPPMCCSVVWAEENTACRPAPAAFIPAFVQEGGGQAYNLTADKNRFLRAILTS
jgi:hypothetical protein